MLWSCHSPNCHWTLLARCCYFCQTCLSSVFCLICSYKGECTAVKTELVSDSTVALSPCFRQGSWVCTLCVDTHRQPIFGMNRTMNNTFFPTFASTNDLFLTIISFMFKSHPHSGLCHLGRIDTQDGRQKREVVNRKDILRMKDGNKQAQPFCNCSICRYLHHFLYDPERIIQAWLHSSVFVVVGWVALTKALKPPLFSACAPE